MAQIGIVVAMLGGEAAVPAATADIKQQVTALLQPVSRETRMLTAGEQRDMDADSQLGFSLFLLDPFQDPSP